MALEVFEFFIFLAEGLGFLVETLFGIFFRGTGEIILYLVTLGKRKPQWKRLAEKRSPFEPFRSPTAWLGFAAWATAFTVVIWIWA